MPRGSPFTQLCQQLPRRPDGIAADLHLHTTASDGEFTPSQVVGFAARAGLKSFAITDHDTFAGHSEAEPMLQSWPGPVPRFVRGVELTCHWRGREVHLLAYLERPNAALLSRCDEMIAVRRERFRDYLKLLSMDGSVEIVPGTSYGRRHVAALILQRGLATTRHEAWHGHLHPLRDAVRPKLAIDLAEAAKMVGDSGGTSSLAHPLIDLSESDLAELKSCGVDAIEAHFPAATIARRMQLSAWAGAIGLHVTGGSDCHGPAGPNRSIGGCGLSAEGLRRLADAPGLAAACVR